MRSMLYCITGANRGIGKYLADELVSRGEMVFGTYNSTQPDPSALNFNKDALSILTKVDIRDPRQVADWIGAITENTEEQMVVINCAGVNYNAAIHKSDPVMWGNVLEVNLVGAYNVIRAVLPYMRNHGFGRIINLSSVVPRIGIPGTSAYAASKAGLWGLARAVAAENAKLGITINTINLGYFNIGMIAEVPTDYLEGIISKIPVGELGDPTEILKAVDYLASAAYITGTEININGGMA